jgi:hypothetical protein
VFARRSAVCLSFELNLTMHLARQTAQHVDIDEMEGSSHVAAVEGHTGRHGVDVL